MTTGQAGLAQAHAGTTDQAAAGDQAGTGDTDAR